MNILSTHSKFGAISWWKGRDFIFRPNLLATTFDIYGEGTKTERSVRWWPACFYSTLDHRILSSGEPGLGASQRLLSDGFLIPIWSSPQTWWKEAPSFISLRYKGLAQNGYWQQANALLRLPRSLFDVTSYLPILELHKIQAWQNAGFHFLPLPSALCHEWS